MLTSPPIGSNAGVSVVSDETVQRLVGAVPHVIVIARKQGEADLVRLHGQKQLMVGAVKAMQGRS
jgi:hypothetical protein